jgi:hypothetical protein
MIARVLSFLLLPFVYAWAKRHEREILKHGSRLSMQQLEDAARVGVQEPERVRLSFVQTVPPRLPRFLRRLAARLGLGPATTAGMALGHGIFVRADQAHRRDLLVHELVHTAQYERSGFAGSCGSICANASPMVIRSESWKRKRHGSRATRRATAGRR